MKNEALLRAYLRNLISEITRYEKETGKKLLKWRERLQKYNGRPNHFVHFSNVPKLGLMPSNQYHTPTGFYGYPFVFEKMANFAKDRKFAIVFKTKDENYLDVARYGSFSKDSEHLREKYEDAVLNYQKNNGKKPGWDYFIKESSEDSELKGDAGKILNLTKLLSKILTAEKTESQNNQSRRSAKESRYLPVRGGQWAAVFIRKIAGKEDITEDDKLNAIEAFKKIIKQYEGKDYIGKTKEEILKSQNGPDDLKHATNGFEDKILTLDKERRYQINYDNLNYLKYVPLKKSIADLSREQQRSTSGENNPFTGKWSSILSDLGYKGIVDPGKGMIHPAEPAQAVFFSVSDVELVEIIEKDKSSEIEGDSYSIQKDNKYRKGNIDKNLNGLKVSNVDFRKSTGSEKQINGSEMLESNFSNVSWDNFIIRASTFDGSSFESANLNGMNALKSSFKSVSFDDASILNSSFKGCDFSSSDFSPETIQGTKFSSCNFENCTLSGFEASGATFENVRFEGARIQSISSETGDLTLKNVEFSNATIRGCTFSSKMMNVQFKNSTLEKVTFVVLGASDLADCMFDRGTTLKKVRVRLSGVDEEEVILPLGVRLQGGFLVND